MILGVECRWVQLLGPSGGQILGRKKKEFVELLLHSAEPELELGLEPEPAARRAPPAAPLPSREPSDPIMSPMGIMEQDDAVINPVLDIAGGGVAAAVEPQTHD